MGAENLVIAAKDIPETSEVTSFSHAFYNCSSLSSVPGMSLWETSQVTSMGFMFNGASAFKGDIAGCDTSKVIDMSWMFNEASVFNQDIGGWNVSNVTDMEAMLSESALSTENYDAILTDCSKRGFFWRGKY